MLGHNAKIAALEGRAHHGYLKSFKRAHWPRRLGVSKSMKSWIKSEVRSGAFHVVHSHGLWMMPNVYPGWATRGTRVPYVVSPHGTMTQWAMANGSAIKRLFWPMVQKPALQNVTCFHATASSEYEDIRRLGFKQPVAVIPNGIDLPESVAQKNPCGDRKLLFLGRIHPQKGLEMLLNVWQKIEPLFPDWSLQIVGEDNNLHGQRFKDQVKELGLSRVKFSGSLFGEDKLAAYQRADLFVLPTFSENFAMAVAEALACSTPVVVTKGAPWSQLESENAGWWPDVGEDALLSALQNAMSLSSEELNQMGNNGRQWMRRDFAWNQIAIEMCQMYEWLLGNADCPDFVVLD